jgi:predicted mannosyl-3-phosphoglycerate phosphatase (HAD superfamily)
MSERQPERMDADHEPSEHQGLTDEEISRMIEEICESKAEEFRLLGYEHVTAQEIWECVSEKYAKTGMPRLHRVVNDIFSLKITQFMNWLTLTAYRGGDLFKDLSKDR